MRVAIDTSYAQQGPSGTAVYIERLIPALRERGVDVVELTQPPRMRRGGRNKLRSAANAVIDQNWIRRGLPRAAQEAGADLIHHPLPAHAPTPLPQVVTVHDVAFARRPQDFDPVWRRIAGRSHRHAVREAAAVVCPSDASARDAAAWLNADPDRVVVAPHGPGQEPPPPASPEDGWFLYVGDDEPRKNLVGLLRAYEQYRVAGGTRDLMLAGKSARRALGAGLLGSDDPLAAYAGAAVLVHPSFEEGFGLTLLEAMHAGVPVLAVRNAAVEELVGDTGLVVDEFALAEALERIDRDPRLRAYMAEASQLRAKDFSWARSAELHERAYTLALS